MASSDCETRWQRFGQFLNDCLDDSSFLYENIKCLYKNINFLHTNLRFFLWKLFMIFFTMFLMIYKISYLLTLQS